MRKKLSFLIALAISLSVTTAAFADAAPAVPSNTTNNISINNDTITLTLEDALNSIEKNNTELKLMNDKINILNKQYDIDHNYATTIDTSVKTPTAVLTNQYLQAKLLQEVVPLNDAQKIEDAKKSRDERLNIIKFDMQRQYLNVLTCKDQIDNINKTLANIDEKIKQLQEKIKVGQAASDALDSLNLQKIQLSSQISDIQHQIDQSLLTIKQYLNIDLNKNLNLSAAKKDYVKFDDTDIVNKIYAAFDKDYSRKSLKNNIDIVKKQNDIYFKYSHNSFTGETSTQSTIVDLQNSLITANDGLQHVLWSYYDILKDKENAVETQRLTEKSAQETYDKAKKNFDVGITDKATLDSAALDLDKQKNLTQRTVNEYMVTQDEYKFILEGYAYLFTRLSNQSIGVSGIGY
ncbi:hypothetical protein [Clostridium sp. DJ247]|uniref:hypothetical protein n=1 Tax=Clostridium sp. DJ247 TaxID=2726188 RepID=UPI001627BD1F|nr:hypothetical protein [Clostridium sp. DJ247]MBC2581562.1 hypothetical protein [Clostridium sp. DJ247]